MKRFGVALALAVVASAVALAEGTAAFKVEVAGVRTTWAPYGEDFAMQPLNTGEGTTVAVLVQGEGIVGFDEDASKIGTFKDDKDTDLTPTKNWAKLRIGENAKVAKDNKAVLVEIAAPNAPTRGAKSLHVEGELALVTASGSEKKEVPATFNLDSQVEGGVEPLVLSRVEDTGWQEFPAFVTWKVKRAPHWLASIACKDEAGKEVKCQPYTVGWESFGEGSKTYMVSVQMAKKLAKGTLILEVRKELKVVMVPVKLDVSVGG